MNNAITYIDRQSGEVCEEKVYGERTLRLFYGSRPGRWLATILAHLPIISSLFGWWQRRPFTKKNIAPFVSKYGLDASEFEKPIDAYPSFDAFFTRKLKPEARPIGEGVIAPADGRYLFYQNIATCDGFIVKGKKFSLQQLIKDPSLADEFKEGSLILARLCPTDYHRFHFPCDCLPSAPKRIRGPLFSVNPIAIKQRIELLCENKRIINQLQSEEYGKVLFIEIGATNVGSIHQTHIPNTFAKKGDEKGYFSFGASSLAILFQKNALKIEKNLLTNSSKHIETLCLMGQSIEQSMKTRN